MIHTVSRKWQQQPSFFLILWCWERWIFTYVTYRQHKTNCGVPRASLSRSTQEDSLDKFLSSQYYRWLGVFRVFSLRGKFSVAMPDICGWVWDNKVMLIMSIGELANFLKRKEKLNKNKQIVNTFCLTYSFIFSLLLLLTKVPKLTTNICVYHHSI